MVELDQLAFREFFTEVPFPEHPERTLKVSGNGVMIDGKPLKASGPPPMLGEHTKEILESLD
ncbi:hypothetical protein B1A_14502 [mine drainage metagenome]|uniref:Uncharacterized protein n=1 Tax=mine drainage metagenome TaxID=410659 RepID=T0ZEX5_9ZZZZ